MSGLGMEVLSTRCCPLCSLLQHIPVRAAAAPRQVCDTRGRPGNNRVLAAAGTGSDTEAQNVAPGMLTGLFTPAKVAPQDLWWS